MFTLSRLLMGGSAIASSGGVASYLVPYLSDTGSAPIFKVDNSGILDLRGLKEAIEKIKQELNEWITKFNQSKRASNTAKNREFSTSLELMKTIQGKEEELKKVYEVIQQKLKTLGEKSQQWSQKVESKLKLQSNLAQLKNITSNLSELINTLNTWEKSISTVISAFQDNTQVSAQESTSGGALNRLRAKRQNKH